MVWQTGAYQAAGVLFENGYIITPKAFFCKDQADVRWQYNTPENPWPPAPAVSSSRLGMTCRPVVDCIGEIPQTSTNDVPENRKTFPLLSSLRNKAVYAEMFGCPHNGAEGQVDPRILNHVNQINVCYDDGSAVPVDTTKIDPIDGLSINAILGQLYALNGIPTGSQMNNIYLDENNTPNRGMWHKFDQARSGGD
jgi:hypothetical protein